MLVECERWTHNGNCIVEQTLSEHADVQELRRQELGQSVIGSSYLIHFDILEYGEHCDRVDSTDYDRELDDLSQIERGFVGIMEQPEATH